MAKSRETIATGRRPVEGRLLRFVIVGAGANLLLLVLTYTLLHFGVPALTASVVGYAVAFGVAYLAQRDWTFSDISSGGSTLSRYAVAQVVCAAAAGLVGKLCGSTLAWAPLETSLAVTATAAIMSYAFSRYWVFVSSES